MFAAASSAIQSLKNALSQSASNRLLGLYLYGSLSQGTYQVGQSDINLLAVFEDGFNLHDLRYVLRPVWREHGYTIRRMPILTTSSTFERHMMLDTNLDRHLRKYAQLLSGDDLTNRSLAGTHGLVEGCQEQGTGYQLDPPDHRLRPLGIG